MKTKLIIGMVLFFQVLSLPSCKDKSPKIGFLMDNLVQERWTRDRDLFVKKVKDLGGQVTVEVAGGEAVKQYTQAEKLIYEGVDVLVVVPVDLNAAAQIAELAHKNNVKVMSYDRLIKNCDLDYYVSFDNVEVGRLQANYMTTVCPKGNYVLINGPPSDNNTFLLELGQMNVLEPLIQRGDIKIIYNRFVDQWSDQEGYRLMKECLRTFHEPVHAVIAANDALARGAIKALSEKGLAGKVYVGGMDAETDACRSIVAGTQTMTVYKPIEAIASTAASVAMQLALGTSSQEVRLTVNNGKKLVPAILLPSMVVNKKTIRLTVVADGYLEANKIYQ
jgi:D-xylose transport system substrate-binding protein